MHREPRPADLWHPVLIVIDEAHVFCPQGAARVKRGRARREEDESDCANAVIDLATRGRKRGFCVAFATQRVSKLDKDATAECNNKLIGRTGQDLDMQRAGDELGFTTREQRLGLRRLRPGRFHGFGPAISDEVVQVQVGEITTSHPEIGQRAAPPAPPRAAVVKLLAEFKDLPTEAKEEARTVGELQKRVRELEASAKRPEKATAPTDTRKALEDAYLKGVGEGHDEGFAAGRVAQAMALASTLPTLRNAITDALDDAERVANAMSIPKPKPNGKTAPAPRSPVASVPAGRRATAVAGAQDGGELDGPMQRVIDAIAWLEALGISEPRTTAVAFLAGYKPTGGAFFNPCGRLAGRGLIERGGSGREKWIKLTDGPEGGRRLAKVNGLPITDAALQEAVLARLDGPERRLLTALLPHGSEGLSNDELAAAAGYDPSGGAFFNPRGRLKSLGLVEYGPGKRTCASIVLYPESN